MVFYKGALTYSELQNMPLPEIFEYQKYAEKINKEQKEQMERQSKRV